MSYQEAKAKYAAYGVDTDAAVEKLKTVPVSLHCWQGDDVRGFDTDPSKPLTGGIQTTGNYPGRARTPKELMADLDKVLSLIPGAKIAVWAATSTPPSFPTPSAILRPFPAPMRRPAASGSSTARPASAFPLIWRRSWARSA